MIQRLFIMNSFDVNKIDVIITHGPCCPDGKTAAWIVWRLFTPEFRRFMADTYGGFYGWSNVKGDPHTQEAAIEILKDNRHPVIVFAQPSSPVNPELVQGRTVLVLDLDLGYSLIPLVKSAAYTILLDHHESSINTIKSFKDEDWIEIKEKFLYIINISKAESGATITWKFFMRTPIPPLVEIIRIGDTWQWGDYPWLQARFVTKGLSAGKRLHTFDDIEETFTYWPSWFSKLESLGRSTQEHDNQMIRRLTKNCTLGFVRGTNDEIYTIAYAMAPVLHSEVGSALREESLIKYGVDVDFCLTWTYEPDSGKVRVSLRNPTPDINLSIISRELFNGGGHNTAAGGWFYNIEDFHKYILKERPF